MAMTMNGEYQLPVPRETVWEKLNDAETLKACIPGCESLDKLSDTEFQAVAVTKIGPVKAKFKGKVTLSDLERVRQHQHRSPFGPLDLDVNAAAVGFDFRHEWFPSPCVLLILIRRRAPRNRPGSLADNGLSSARARR